MYRLAYCLALKTAMLIADSVTERHAVDVERSCARKVQYNARGAIGLRCNLNLRHYYKTH